MSNAALEERIALFSRCISDRDAAVAEDVLDPEFALVLVHPAPAVVARDRWLQMLPDYVVHDYVIEEHTLDVDGDVAVMMHRAAMSATVLGEDRSGVFVITDVWRRRGGAWRLWRRHSTPLSAGEMPGA